MGIFSATFSSVRLLVTEKETWSWTSGEELWPRRPMLAARTSTTNTSLLGPLLCRRPGRRWASRGSVQWTATRLRARPCMPRPRPFGGHEMPRYASAVPAFVVVHGARFAMICLAGHFFSMYSCTNCWAADSRFILSTNMFARVKMRFEKGKGFLVTTAWTIQYCIISIAIIHHCIYNYNSVRKLTLSSCCESSQDLKLWATLVSFLFVSLHCGKTSEIEVEHGWRQLKMLFHFKACCSLLSNSLSSIFSLLLAFSNGVANEEDRHEVHEIGDRYEGNESDEGDEEEGREQDCKGQVSQGLRVQGQEGKDSVLVEGCWWSQEFNLFFGLFLRCVFC